MEIYFGWYKVSGTKTPGQYSLQWPTSFKSEVSNLFWQKYHKNYGGLVYRPHVWTSQ